MSSMFDLAKSRGTVHLGPRSRKLEVFELAPNRRLVITDSDGNSVVELHVSLVGQYMNVVYPSHCKIVSQD